MKGKKVLVTGAAGFIGFHTIIKLLEESAVVYGIDDLNDYYDVELKKARLDFINKKNPLERNNWFFSKVSLENKLTLGKIFDKFDPDIVVHLGAQAGVRYSIDNPSVYINSNLLGFSNILEFSRTAKIENLIYASSSSVYGANQKIPFSELDPVNHPVSLYAATKKSNELMAHVYSHLYNIPSVGLRFFTVYGPWGRPDMAPMIFAKSILENIPIRIFNNGKMSRDFTYISDVVEVIFRCCSKKVEANKNFNKLQPESSSSFAPHRILNVGNGNPVNLLEFIEILESNLGCKAVKSYLPMQPGDVENTYADTTLLEEYTNYKPIICLKKGLKYFSDWYKNFYMNGKKI